jgi:GMP synthase PP-ATPase subunit
LSLSVSIVARARKGNGRLTNLVDGVMRLNECEQVQKDLSEALGINLTVVDASKEFLDGLKGVEDPEVGARFSRMPLQYH